MIVAELGLFGACGLIACYALIGARGFKTAVMAPDGFSKLLATGLTAVFCLQAFVIIGGVVKLIPLTGVTLPFISYGGSSIVANMILLALLLLVSDRARRPSRESGVNNQIVRLYALVLLLFVGLVAFTSRWAVLEADELDENPQNRRPLIEEQQIERGTITTSDGVLIAESHPAGGGAAARVRPHLPAGGPCSATRSATRSSRSGAPRSSWPRTTCSPARRTSSRR